MTEPRPAFLVDAFTTVAYRGNPAGVVLDARDLSETQMQWIAEEIHASATAFVLPSGREDTSVRLRFFTPRKEVPLSAHATIAAFHVLQEQGRLPAATEGEDGFLVEVRGGLLPVVRETSDGESTAWVSLPIPELEPVSVDREHLMELLGLSVFDLRGGFPLERYGDYVLVPVKSREGLRRIRPDFYRLVEFGHTAGLAAFACFTTETEDDGSRAHLRFFAPEEGVHEDPVTGEAIGPCAVYLHERGLVRGESDVREIVCEQGDALGRPSRVRVRLGIVRRRVGLLQVGGGAITVLRGSIRAPEPAG